MMKNESEKINLKKLINWNELSFLLKGNKRTVRSNRPNKKYQKQIEDLELHLEDWAKKNNIDILK